MNDLLPELPRPASKKNALDRHIRDCLDPVTIKNRLYHSQWFQFTVTGFSISPAGRGALCLDVQGFPGSRHPRA